VSGNKSYEVQIFLSFSSYQFVRTNTKFFSAAYFLPRFAGYGGIFSTFEHIAVGPIHTSTHSLCLQQIFFSQNCKNESTCTVFCAEKL
jgi:hypothetical protein